MLLSVPYGLKHDLVELLLEPGLEGGALSFQFAQFSPTVHVLGHGSQTLSDRASHPLDDLDRDGERYLGLDPRDSLSRSLDFSFQARFFYADSFDLVWVIHRSSFLPSHASSSALINRIVRVPGNRLNGIGSAGGLKLPACAIHR